MKILPLAFNLVDYDKNVAVIGNIPSSAIPQSRRDSALVSFWKNEFESNEILNKGGKLIVSSASYPKKYTHPSQFDDFFQEIAPMPKSEKIKTFFLVPNPLEWNVDFLIGALMTSRPKNSSLILFFEEFSVLPDGLQKAIFGTCSLIIIGNLSENDKDFFLKNRYFSENTEAILNLKENEYVLYNQSYHRKLILCINESFKNLEELDKF